MSKKRRRKNYEYHKKQGRSYVGLAKANPIIKAKFPKRTATSEQVMACAIDIFGAVYTTYRKSDD
jgi:hypothetical protein